MADGFRPQQALDTSAVCLSAACLVHCLVLPLLISITPWLIPAALVDERVHLWGVALALPLSAVGIAMGVRAHRQWVVIALAGAGLLALAVSALWVEGRLLETLLSVAGAMTLASAHLLNWRLRRNEGVRA